MGIYLPISHKVLVDITRYLVLSSSNSCSARLKQISPRNVLQVNIRPRLLIPIAISYELNQLRSTCRPKNKSRRQIPTTPVAKAEVLPFREVVLARRALLRIQIHRSRIPR